MMEYYGVVITLLFRFSIVLLATENSIYESQYEMSGEDFILDFVFNSRPLLVHNTVKNWPVYDVMHHDQTVEQLYLQELVLTVNCDNVSDTEKSSFKKLHLVMQNCWFEYEITGKVPYVQKLIFLPAMMITCQQILADYQENGRAFLFGTTSMSKWSKVFISNGHVFVAVLKGAIQVELKDQLLVKLVEGDLFYVPPSYPAIFYFENNTVLVNLTWFEREAYDVTLCDDRPPIYAMTRDLPKINNSFLYENSTIPDIVLNTGYKIPPLGLGTGRLFEKTFEVVKQALSFGYKLFDTAQIYSGERNRNNFSVSSEQEIGRALKDSTVLRSDLFLLTKINPEIMTHDGVTKAVMKSLEHLQTPYLDAVLIHDFNSKIFCGAADPNCHESPWICWRALEKLQARGVVRSIGVSNIGESDLLFLINEFAENKVSIVQNWFDPLHQDKIVRKICNENNITYMGYSTLGAIWSGESGLGFEKNPVLFHEVILNMAAVSDVSTTSFVLRWAMEKNVIVIPCSSNPEHLDQNLAATRHKYVIEEQFPYMDNLDNILGNPDNDDWDKLSFQEISKEEDYKIKEEL